MSVVFRGVPEFESLRQQVFSEGIERIFLRLPPGGRVVGGCSSSEGVHFMSVNPLMVHSLLCREGGVGAGVGVGLRRGLGLGSSLGPQSEYVALELLGEEMGYRLGQFRPLLAALPVGGSGGGGKGGVVLIVPELSMALKIGFSGVGEGLGAGVVGAGGAGAGAGVSVEMLSIPLPRALIQPQTGGGTSAKKSFASLFGAEAGGEAGDGARAGGVPIGDMCIATITPAPNPTTQLSNEGPSDDHTHSPNPNNSPSPGSNPVVIYRRGGSEVALVDFPRAVVGCLSMVRHTYIHIYR